MPRNLAARARLWRLSAPRQVEPPREAQAEAAQPPAQDNTPPDPPADSAVIDQAEIKTIPPASEPEEPSSTPVFRQRHEMPKTGTSRIPPVIPIVRPPDDPGIEDDAVADDFAEQSGRSERQAGGWRGFLSRWGG